MPLYKISQLLDLIVHWWVPYFSICRMRVWRPLYHHGFFADHVTAPCCQPWAKSWRTSCLKQRRWSSVIQATGPSNAQSHSQRTLLHECDRPMWSSKPFGITVIVPAADWVWFQICLFLFALATAPYIDCSTGARSDPSRVSKLVHMNVKSYTDEYRVHSVSESNAPRRFLKGPCCPCLKIRGWP